jgi:nitrate/nitrite-specific signal transduction histidine kinase
LRVCIDDDGLGFDEEAAEEGHYGFRNMRERAALIGGQLRISPRAGKGSRVELRVALKGGPSGAHAHRDR